MNCVQCGEGLPDSAKFCKKCGHKVDAQAALAKDAAPRNLPAAPAPAYTTCPDCGALCKADARFCNKCGCRFEENSGFEDTRPHGLDEPNDAEKAVMVFGNVQDISEPASGKKSTPIETSPAMVIGSAASVAAVAAPSLRLTDPAPLVQAPAAEPARVRKPMAEAPTAAAPVVAATVSSTAAASPSPITKSNNNPPSKSSEQSTKKPSSEGHAQAAQGSGAKLVMGLGTVALLLGGGAWWWSQQGKSSKVKEVVAPTAVAPSPAPPPTPPVAIPTEATLAPEESMEVVKPAEPITAVEVAPAAVPEASTAAAEPAARPAPRKPARKQSLDDLLN